MNFYRKGAKGKISWQLAVGGWQFPSTANRFVPWWLTFH